MAGGIDPGLLDVGSTTGANTSGTTGSNPTHSNTLQQPTGTVQSTQHHTRHRRIGHSVADPLARASWRTVVRSYGSHWPKTNGEASVW